MTIDYTQPPQPPQPPQAPRPPRPPRPPAPPGRPGNWWTRNWKWVVALGCVTPILLFGACATGIVWVAFTAMRSSEPYTEALDRARNHPEVIQRLGTPIEPKWYLTGTVKIEEDGGSANLKVPISGPKDSGFIEVVASRSDGRWVYSRMSVLTSSGSPIDLLDPSTQEPPDTEPAAG